MENFLILFLLFAYYVFHSYTLMLIAKKTEAKYIWLAWIPIINFLLVTQIAKVSELWLILLLVPIVNFLIVGMLYAGIAEARGKPGWLGIFAIFPFFTVFIQGYLAFSR